MKRILFIILSIVTILFLNGCKEEIKTKEEEFNDIQKTFNSMQTYTCTADITVKGNKGGKGFEVRHTFKKPNKYISEIIAPDNNKGNKTVYNGSQAYLYNKQINQYTILKDIKESEEKLLFLGSFLENLNTTKEVKIDSKSIEEREYITIEMDVAGNNRYREYQVLWVDKKTHKPHGLVVFDSQDNEVVNVLYTDVEYDVDILDDAFTIK